MSVTIYIYLKFQRELSRSNQFSQGAANIFKYAHIKYAIYSIKLI